MLAEVAAVGATNAPAAITLLREVDLDKASPALDFALGNLYFQTEKLKEAATAYQAAITKLPRFRAAIMNLGRVHLLQEDNQAAIKLYQELVRDGQATGDILVLLGQALLMEERAVSAENAFRQALLLKPDDTTALTGLAKCLLLQERFREGRGLTAELLRKDPANGEIWLLRANSLLAVDKTDEALRVLESARRLGCADSGMLALLADLYLNAGQPDEAVARYEEAFASSSASAARMLRAAEGFLMLERPQHAKRLLDKIGLQKLVGEERRKLDRIRAMYHVRMGSPDKARGLLRGLLRENPLDGDVLMALGKLEYTAGNAEAAVMTYERAARLPGFEINALLEQAQVEVERERYARAVELLETAQTFEAQAHVARYLEQVRRLAAQAGRTSR